MQFLNNNHNHPQIVKALINKTGMRYDVCYRDGDKDISFMHILFYLAVKAHYQLSGGKRLDVTDKKYSSTYNQLPKKLKIKINSWVITQPMKVAYAVARKKLMKESNFLYKLWLRFSDRFTSNLDKFKEVKVDGSGVKKK